ncbi:MULTISPECIES: TetR/AcrR family transcriptional regulator [Cellulomonas]|uniref:TetR/AcrR family transcriptional repressor of mexJK operon n=1 Tax=Cellulomonas iranensis TaxID=76862 RepID=A0ABU0GQG5_9CELL|nr:MULTISPECIES: TetR/AcrR family transcriptional regulator [Cellulomonas]MDQ0427011.1 TetR/AcrR family transcriptional repressor of mexJK operon [Cellulomonas iranensis]TFH69497.1 TetR/AcrR family transcriptional regulator [Cellulomonas sp. HD19AZ1]
MTTLDERPVRAGQAHKRAAILAAARELFVQSGVDRTSMDAVAARAGVSKRTVYDYYGDKRRLLLGVVEEAGERALETLREHVAHRLGDATPLREPAALERAFVDLASDLGDALLLSADHLAAVRLVTENEQQLPELDGHPLDEAQTRVLADRLDDLTRAGLLDAPDPALAAEHFHALTTLRVLNEPSRRRAERTHVLRIMTDGARAFVRAYAARPGA